MLRWPGSLTESVASPAVEVTVASVVAVYSFATPGVNAPNDAGPLRLSASVAGTVPPTVPGVSVTAPIVNETDLVAVVPAAFVPRYSTVCAPGRSRSPAPCRRSTRRRRAGTRASPR